jgi:hypothetical protein
VTWSARDTSAIASYDVQVSADGGPWAAWLTKTRATSDVWLGADRHGYAFRVRATDAKGNAGAWNVSATWDAEPALAPGGFGRVRLDGLPDRPGTGMAFGTLAQNIVAMPRPVSGRLHVVRFPAGRWNLSFVDAAWIAVFVDATYLHGLLRLNAPP